MAFCVARVRQHCDPLRPEDALTGRPALYRTLWRRQRRKRRRLPSGDGLAWLLAHFGEALLRVAEDKGEAKLFLLDLIRSFLRQHVTAAGIGCISEIFDGDPPHQPNGCISQAWCVGELIRLYTILDEPGLDKPGNEFAACEPFPKVLKRSKRPLTMKILMFGGIPSLGERWLGTACFGMTRALTDLGHEIVFVLPRTDGDGKPSHVKLIRHPAWPSRIVISKNLPSSRVCPSAPLIPFSGPTCPKAATGPVIRFRTAPGSDPLRDYGADLISEVVRYGRWRVSLPGNALSMSSIHDWRRLRRHRGQTDQQQAFDPAYPCLRI